MLNIFKLKESFFGFYVLIACVLGFLFIVAQISLAADEKFGNKEKSTQTQKIEYVIEKGGVEYKKTYELKIFINDEDEIYRTDLSSAGETIQ